MKSKFSLLFFMDLMQDLDVLGLLIQASLKHSQVNVRVYVTTGLLKRSPRVASTLKSWNIAYFPTSRAFVLLGLEPKLENYHALITASESNAKPHRIAHRLTKRANQKGVSTYTIQHGLENIGLTYTDDDYKIGEVSFASQAILTWGSEKCLHPDVSEYVANRCIPVGYPKEIPKEFPSLPVFKEAAFVVSVFENLHWKRYSKQYRKQFIDDLYDAAKNFPEITFLIKPHHDECWMLRHLPEKFSTQKNMIIIDVKDPLWEPYTAPAIIGLSKGVITTPSTVALDAAMQNIPTAVAGYDLNLEVYQPLLILKYSKDWQKMLQLLYENYEDESWSIKSKMFKDRLVVDGDSSEKILNEIIQTKFLKPAGVL